MNRVYRKCIERNRKKEIFRIDKKKYLKISKNKMYFGKNFFVN